VVEVIMNLPALTAVRQVMNYELGIRNYELGIMNYEFEIV